MILDQCISKSLTDHPDALVGNLSEMVSYRQLRDLVDEKSRALTEAIDLSMEAPARIGIVRRNAPAYVSDFLAVLRIGAVPFLIDPALAAHEVATLDGCCGFDGILHDGAAQLPQGRCTVDCRGTSLWFPAHRPSSRPALAPDTEVCRLTSGSTRSPACIEFSGSAVSAAAQAWCSASELGGGDRILCFAGLYNGLAFNTSLIPGLLAGADLLLPAGLPSPSNIVRHLLALEPTVLVAFPAAYDHLATSHLEWSAQSRLRLALSSAARLSQQTSVTLAERSIHIADYYGIAETGPLTFNADPTPGGGQGYPLPGVSLRTEDVKDGIGTLLARSKSAGTRYLNYPNELEGRFTADGYYRTTDRGRLSSSGELQLVGRLGNSFNLGGRKFSSEEVENLLVSHPAVAAGAAAVVSPRGGRPFLGAVVVRKCEVDPVELRRHYLARAAPFKVPERIVFVDALPMNGAGKIQGSKIEQLLLTHCDPH